jgi:hypothetical protein
MYGMGMEMMKSLLFMILNNSNSPSIAVADFQNPKLPFSEHSPRPLLFCFSVVLFWYPTTQRHQLTTCLHTLPAPALGTTPAHTPLHRTPPLPLLPPPPPLPLLVH